MTTYTLYLVLLSAVTYKPVLIITPVSTEDYTNQVSCIMDGNKLLLAMRPYNLNNDFILHPTCVAQRKKK